MLDKLTIERFASEVGSRFVFRIAEHAFEAELTEATGADSPPAEGMRDPFSLVFRGPPDPVFAQNIFRVEHERLGELDLFAVPIGSGPEGTLYQVVFN